MENLFTQASRQKLRFTTPAGNLSVEDLWDLPLASSRSNAVTLDAIAMNLDKSIKDSGTTSFVKKATRTNANLRLAFDIVLYVIGVRQEEEEAAENLALNAQKKQRILEIISQKEDAELAGKDVSELRELASSL